MENETNTASNLSRRRIMAGALAAGATVGVAGSRAQAQTLAAASMLDGQTALVTGAARGIGRAIAVALAEAGANVASVDVLEDLDGFPIPMGTASDLDETKAAVEAAGRRFMSVKADIRDLAALRAGVARTQAELGPIDILVANAGVNTNAGFLSDDEAAWRTHWDMITDVNVKGTANTIRAAMPGMVERQSGRVIIISSTFGRQGNGTNPAYIASKWAVIGLAKAAAIEAGKSGVTVNTIAPTAVRTGLGGVRTAEQNAQADEWLKANYHQLDVGILEPEDIAGSAVFLASPAAAMITGSTIDVSAGAAARYTA